jgi:hypothetical protein
MNLHPRSVARLRAATIFLCLLFTACAGSNDGDVIDPAKSGLNGTWTYLVTNAFDATFSGCTGDAAVLEGETFHDGLALAPICRTSITFDVSQVGEVFQVPAYQVTCTDGASGSMSGFGQIVGPQVGGQWDSASDTGVTATQIFTGTIVGDTIQVRESRRTFSGTFQGACDFSPELMAEVTVDPPS